MDSLNIQLLGYSEV